MKPNIYLRRIDLLLLITLATILIIIATISNVSFEDISILPKNETQDIKRSILLVEDRDIFLTNKHIDNQKFMKHEIMKTNSLGKLQEHTQYPSKTLVATGYTAGVESTGKTPNHPEYGITFSGVEVRRDTYSTIAADLSVFPIGTILYIPNYGYGVVADKGSAIKGNKIDLYYETVEDVYEQWGKRTVKVYIIEMGKGLLSRKQLNQLNENNSIKVFQDKILEK